MGFKCMIVVLLQATLTMVICSRMVVNDLVSRKESVKIDRETNFQKSHPIMSIQVGLIPFKFSAFSFSLTHILHFSEKIRIFCFNVMV